MSLLPRHSTARPHAIRPFPVIPERFPGQALGYPGQRESALNQRFLGVPRIPGAIGDIAQMHEIQPSSVD